MQKKKNKKKINKQLNIFDIKQKKISREKIDSLFLGKSYELDSSYEISVMDLIEKNWSFLKKEFLEWNTSLPNIKIKNETIIKRMSSDAIYGRSFWWGTTIHNRSPLENPQIVNIFKIREIEKLIIKKKYDNIKYFGNNPIIENCLAELSSHLKINYSTNVISYRNYIIQKLKLITLKNFPYFFLALAYYLIFIFRWIKSNIIFDFKSKKSIFANKFIISYLFPFDKAYAQKNKYRSQYFGKLHESIEKTNVKANWLLLYSRNSELSYFKSLLFLKKINRNPSIAKNQNFFFIEQCLSVHDLIKVISLYIKNYFQFYPIKDLGRYFKIKSSNFNFFNVLVYNLNSSLYGSSSLKSCIYAVAFDKIFKNIDNKAELIYIFENSTWEQFALYSWKKYQKGNSLAIAHSPSIAADTNLKSYLYDKLEYDNSRRSKALPDKIVAPGDLFTKKMISSGWEQKRFIKLESLKYSYLNELGNKANIQYCNKDTSLLIITGYMYNETFYQLRIFSESLKKGYLKKFKKIFIKPHHDCPIEGILTLLNINLSAKIEISENTLEKYNPKITTCFLANSTSAVFDIIYCKMNYLIAGSGETLNLNPLYNLIKINYINSADDLQKQIRASKIKYNFKRDDLFYSSKRGLNWETVILKK